jgi:ribosomal protein S18 acetylase RimI-like enzyme
MVCLRWMRRAYKSPARVFNQKMLSGMNGVFYCLSTPAVVTHFLLPQTGNRGVMKFEWRAATDRDLEFARELTCSNMLRYYIEHDLLWQDEAFDVAWAGRDNRLIMRGENRVGYVSLSRDAKALYIRELQIAEGFRRLGAGSWAIDQVFALAGHERRPALRLTVFENNPARALYERKGLQVVGTDECFLRMQRDVEGPHR